MILSSEISIIVQGPVVENLTRRCLLSIRKIFPESELILSTWNFTPVDKLPFDKVVFSEDPGGILLAETKTHKYYSNINRQIISTKAGLNAATRKYAIKFRTDMLFFSSNFLNFFFLYPFRNEQYRFLKNRLIVSTIFSPNPSRNKKPFSISDWFTFGLTEDVKNLWNIPLAPEPETSLWFKSHPLPSSEKDTMRYRPEQYIWLSFLRKYIDVPCEHQWDYGEHNRVLHELSLVNNVILLHPREIGIHFTIVLVLEHGLTFIIMLNGYYKKYCDPNYPLPINWRSPIQNALSRWVEQSPRFHHLLSWYDYRYVKFTQIWNSANRFEILKKNLFLKNKI